MSKVTHMGRTLSETRLSFALSIYRWPLRIATNISQRSTMQNYTIIVIFSLLYAVFRVTIGLLMTFG